MNILESTPHVDKILVCEADFTHVGKPRELIYDDLIKGLPPEERNKIEYIPLRIGKLIDRHLREGDLFHSIERIIGDQFCREFPVQNGDYIIAVDADEIVYGEKYPGIFKQLSNPFQLGPKCYRLRLHQFFFCLDYFWSNLEITVPVATRASVFLNKPRPAMWRNYGKMTEGFSGVHFSWIMDIEQMIFKLANYAHHDIYGHLADREVLTEAIRERKYVFDPNVDFQIKKLRNDDPIYPKTFSRVFPANHKWFSANHEALK